MEKDMLREGGLRPSKAELRPMSPKDRRNLEFVWQKNAAIKEQLDWMDRRFKQIAEFEKATKIYRRAKGDVERHEALLGDAPPGSPDRCGGGPASYGRCGGPKPA